LKVIVIAKVDKLTKNLAKDGTLVWGLFLHPPPKKRNIN
jgi:hypothetical protein